MLAKRCHWHGLAILGSSHPVRSEPDRITTTGSEPAPGAQSPLAGTRSAVITALRNPRGPITALRKPARGPITALRKPARGNDHRFGTDTRSPEPARRLTTA